MAKTKKAHSEPREPARYALVDVDGHTINIVLWDGAAEYPIPEGLTLVPADEAPPYIPEPPIE